MIIRRKDAQKRGWDGLNFWVYNTKEDFANASAALFEVTGSHGKVKSTVSDRTYFVVEGNGFFEINDEKVAVVPNDVIIVPKNAPYDYWAKEGEVLKLFLVHTPAFDASGEVNLTS